MPARRRIVLHIGLPKTGTSTIQAVLGASAPALARAGLLYPVSGRLRGAHHPLAWALRGPATAPERAPEANRPYDIQQWDNVRREAEAADARTVLVSSEHFALRGEPEIARLAARLHDWDVAVVALGRTPRQFLVSWWQEEVKAGERQSLAEALPRLLKDPITLVDPVLERWRNAFGSDSVAAADLPATGSADAVLATFCEVARLPTGWWADAVPSHNESLGWDHVEALRALNLALAARCEAHGRPYEEWKFAPERERLLDSLATRDAGLPKPELSDDAWRRVESGQLVRDDDLGFEQSLAREAGRILLAAHLRAEQRLRSRINRGAKYVSRLTASLKP